MHRNTYLFVTFLAVFAALVVGVNLGKRSSPPSNAMTTITPTPLRPSDSAGQAPTPTTALYTNKECGFSLDYPAGLTLMEGATGSAFLVNTQNQNESVAIACQEEIPRPPLTADKIETRTIYNPTKTASVSARLYHDASAKDGTPIDELIFRHPKTGIDIFIAGFGETFDNIIATVKLLQ